MGVMSPGASWGRRPLYSRIHHYVASRTSSSEVNQYRSSRSSRYVRLNRSANVEIIKRSDTGRFAVLPKRWVVERTFSWFEKNRRLWKNCERLIESSLGMMLLANIALLLRRS
ncbi:MAG: transposase [Gammaproteobacteria bacterium]|nr:transposase [Gammaproteobacteria bacterium]